jgi:hypothetical protein
MIRRATVTAALALALVTGSGLAATGKPVTGGPVALAAMTTPLPAGPWPRQSAATP